MDAEIIIRGEVLGQQESNFEGKVSRSIHLMKPNAKGGVELLKVKLAETLDPKKYLKGANVELAVDVNVFESNIYFKATRDAAAKPDARPTPAKA